MDLLGRVGRGAIAFPALIGLVAFVLRVRTALAEFETYDERTWAMLSDGFGHSLAAGDPSKMSAVPVGDTPPHLFATLPGVTTMWVGAAARVVWSWGLHLGLWSKKLDDSEFDTFGFEPSALDVAQVMMALVVSVLLGVIVWLLVHWIGRLAAAVAGTLLATEPFLVAHGAVLHTDELAWFFGLAGVVALALVLGIPEPTRWKGRRSMAVLAGVFLAGSFLTKVTAILLLPGLGFLVAWACWVAWRGEPERDRDDGEATDRRRALRPTARTVGWVVGLFVVTILVAYPALWARPGTEIQLISDSASQGGVGHHTFFRGAGTETPGWQFYFVALPLRATPWLLCAGAVAAVAAWFRRRTRGIAVVLAAVAVVPLLTLSLASKQFDRYGLLLPMLAAVLIGVVVSEAWTWWRETHADNRTRTRWLTAGAALAAGVAVVNSFVVAPWGLAYFNPLLRGSYQAQRSVLVGWGEGSEKAGPALERLLPDDVDCEDIEVDFYFPLFNGWRCGETVLPGEPADYVIVYIGDAQSRRRWVADRTFGRELLGEVHIRGIPYLRIYGPRERR